MAVVRTRRTSSTAPVSRRRDRVEAVDEEDDEELEDVDAVRRPARKKAAAKRTTTRRKPTRVVEEDEDEDLDDEEDLDEEDEDEEPPRRRKPAAKKKPARRRPAPVEEDEDEDDEELDEEEEEEDDEDEDEEEPPRRRRTTAKSKTTKRAAKSKLPPGVRTGRKGAEEIRAAGGGGADRLTITNEPVLVKVLENEPFVSYRQHWVPSGGGQPDRPYTCPGKSVCPLCKLGDRSNASVVYNVLVLSGDSEPENKIMGLGVKADKALEAAATKNGKVNIARDYWAVTKSGKGQQTQTNFRPVKQRDLEEDWPEIFENFDPEDLPAIIEEAKENLFDASIVEVRSMKQLREVSKFLADDDEDDDD